MKTYYYKHEEPYLMHYGVKGMKWGVRRYQNADGTLTAKGKKRERKDRLRRAKKYSKYYKQDRSDFLALVEEAKKHQLPVGTVLTNKKSGVALQVDNDGYRWLHGSKKTSRIHGRDYLDAVEYAYSKRLIDD